MLYRAAIHNYLRRTKINFARIGLHETFSTGEAIHKCQNSNLAPADGFYLPSSLQQRS